MGPSRHNPKETPQLYSTSTTDRRYRRPQLSRCSKKWKGFNIIFCILLVCNLQSIFQIQFRSIFSEPDARAQPVFATPSKCTATKGLFSYAGVIAFGTGLKSRTFYNKYIFIYLNETEKQPTLSNEILSSCRYVIIITLCQLVWI